MKHYAVRLLADRHRNIFTISLWIAATDAHHADRRSLIEDHFAAIQVALRHTLKKFDKITLQSEHNRLRFGVAHAAVVFDYLRSPITIDQAEEDKAAVVQAVSRQAFDRGSHDLIFYALHPFFRGKRYGRNGTHTARVQARIAFADAFVVFCFR